jgi:hypothetical protein
MWGKNATSAVYCRYDKICRGDRNRPRWFGHVERKVDDDWVRRCTLMEVDEMRSRGRPRKVEECDDLRKYDLHTEDAMNRCLWRGRVHGANWPTQVILENHRCVCTYGIWL